ncbi:nitroreductase family protein [Sphingobacterium sp. SYP-B4668]|uniref:nitroreductase family protein n=1 Tax=Sphingobacterium sp. SYP-B4668 TaxID=2996035 RepID=UPI0022DDDB31|nr:nitroreductase family protein [Sphingobacterium sp. SYP-B4668]
METFTTYLRELLRPILEINSIRKALESRFLFRNFKEDARLYQKYAAAFDADKFKNKEAHLILHYHSLEKGMLFNKMKGGFGAYRLKKLHAILTDPEIILNRSKSQVRVGYQVMCQYYELHRQAGYDLEDLFTYAQYNFYKSILGEDYTAAFRGVLEWTKDQFYTHVDSNFADFARSRKSVRNFTGEYIAEEVIRKVVELANTAPSVCNRQASNVYLIQDKIQIERILAVQGGFAGYEQHVSQLLIVTNDRRYYYTIGERNQLYIDGGLYLMNLLYALHYYRIGNCPANWGKNIKEELPINAVVSIPPSEKIICIVPIGVVPYQFKTTLSQRRVVSENLIVVDTDTK